MYIIFACCLWVTIFIHHRQSRYSSLGENGQRVVHGGRLLYGGDVSECPDSSFFNFPLQKPWRWDRGSLHVTKCRPEAVGRELKIVFIRAVPKMHAYRAGLKLVTCMVNSLYSGITGTRGRYIENCETRKWLGQEKAYWKQRNHWETRKNTRKPRSHWETREPWVNRKVLEKQEIAGKAKGYWENRNHW